MSQTEGIMQYMRRHGGITPIEALQEFGCMRLAARIDDLRRTGVPIQTEIVYRGGKRWARYSLREVA